MKIGIAALAAVGLMSAAAPASAQSEYIRQALDRGDAQWGGRASATLVSHDISLVYRDQTRVLTYAADEDARITVISGCDTDCNTVRLSATDFRDREQAYRQDTDGSTEISFYVVAGQTYTITVEHPDCDQPYCWATTFVYR